MARLPGWSIAMLAASSLIGSASGASMYAFYPGPDKGAQIGVQDPKTGNIMVNNCNADIDGAPLYPTQNPNILPTTNKPKIGGSIAATGWWDNVHVIASVFWHSESGKIVNGLYQCDPESGNFTQQGEYIISDTAGVDSIHSDTGLAVELLGSTTGYRVFYHNNQSQVNAMWYTDTTNWRYFGSVSQDPTFSMALASSHASSNTNITVVFPKSAKDVEVSRINTDGTWHISTFPDTIEDAPTNLTAPSKIGINPKVTPKFSLPAWNGKPGALGAAVDSSFTRYVFYIGSDRKLHEVASINFIWQMMPDQTASSWPLADDANANLAVTYNSATSETWVYYVSNGGLIQAYKGTDGTWGNFTALPTSGGTPGGSSGSGSGSDSGSGDGDSSNANTGLSGGAKAGIGIGVSVGAIGVGLLGLFFFLRRRRQRAAASAAEADKEQPINMGQYHSPSEQAMFMADGSLAPAYTPQTPYDSPDATKKSTPDMSMHPAMVSPLVEMEQPPTIYELPPTNFSYELPAENVERR
ncbi:hypothetical protein V8C35DRAFT_332629 [Trichoderma chlorosporum]